MGDSQKLGRCSISPVTTLSHAYGAITHVSKGFGVLSANAVEDGLYVCAVHCLGLLDSHSHTGKLLMFSGESQTLQPNFCWSVHELQAPSGTETTFPIGSDVNEQSRAGSYSILPFNQRLQQSYGRLQTLSILDCTANCKLFPLLKNKIRFKQMAFAVFHTIWPFCSAVLRMRNWSQDWQLVNLLKGLNDKLHLTEWTCEA